MDRRRAQPGSGYNHRSWRPGLGGTAGPRRLQSLSTQVARLQLRVSSMGMSPTPLLLLNDTCEGAFTCFILWLYPKTYFLFIWFSSGYWSSVAPTSLTCSSDTSAKRHSPHLSWGAPAPALESAISPGSLVPLWRTNGLSNQDLGLVGRPRRAVGPGGRVQTLPWVFGACLSPSAS